MDSSEFIKEMFIRSLMISLYNILAEYFESFIHKEDHDRIEGNTVKFVLDTLAALQKKVKEENTLMLDNAKMLLNNKQTILNKFIERKHYGAGANARHFLLVIEEFMKDDLDDLYSAVGRKQKVDIANCWAAIPDSLK